MGAPKPWTTRYPEPDFMPDMVGDEPLPYLEPDYQIEENPQEEPYPLPEEALRPRAATWGVTHPCNLKCSHCYDVVDYARRDLPTSQALEVIDRLAGAGIQFLVFSGGEPLLRKDLFTLLAHCRTYEMGTALRTNATLITEDKADQLAALGLSVAGISLDGATADVHDAVRGVGAFQRTLEGLQHLLDRQIRVNLEVVLSRRNAPQALAFIGLAEQLGVAEMNFSTLTPQGRGIHLTEDYLTFAEWQGLNWQLYHASTSAKINVSPSCAFVGMCVACVEPNITCDGWVTACYLSKRKLFHILEVPVDEIILRLQAARLDNLEVCGRPSWAVRATRRVTARPV